MEGLDKNNIKLINTQLMRKFDGMMPVPAVSTILAAPGQQIFEFDFRRKEADMKMVETTMDEEFD